MKKDQINDNKEEVESNIGNLDDRVYKIVKVEKLEDEVRELTDNMHNTDRKILELKVANVVTIALGICSLLIKYPKVFGEEFLLNILGVIVSLISTVYVVLEKKSLMLMQIVMNFIRENKIDLMLNKKSELLEDVKEKKLGK